MKCLLILFLAIPFNLLSQTTLEPYAVYYGTHVNSARNSFSNTVVSYEKSFASAIGLGLDFRHQLKNKFSIQYGLTSSFFKHNSRIREYNPFLGETIDKGVTMTSLSRWDYHLGFGFLSSHFLSFQLNSHVINQPYKTNTNFSGRRPLRVVEFGLSGKVSFVRKRLSGGLFYYHGLHKTSEFRTIYLPIKSIGFELRYHFELKQKKKNKYRRR